MIKEYRILERGDKYIVQSRTILLGIRLRWHTYGQQSLLSDNFLISRFNSRSEAEDFIKKEST